MGVFWAVVSGLIVGMIIGLLAEYYTSSKPVIEIAESSKTGPATVPHLRPCRGHEKHSLTCGGDLRAMWVAYESAGCTALESRQWACWLRSA